MKRVVCLLALMPVLACGQEEWNGGPAQVVVSFGHRCVAKGGRVWCWGTDTAGQTGQSSSGQGSRPDPVLVAGVDGVVELAASDAHTCARLQNGRVACWGANAFSESAPNSAPIDTCQRFWLDSGPEDVPCQPTPTLVHALTDARQLALGEQRSCAVHANGSVRCWGQGTRGADWAAMRFGVQQLAVGNQDACVGQADGTLACSGSQPETIQRWTGVEQLAMSTHSGLACVRHAGGRVNCWGDNFAGQRGIGKTDRNIPLPDDPPAIAAGASAIAVGFAHACALMADGTVLCWGQTHTGTALPLPENICSSTICQMRPRKVEGLPPVVSLAAGGSSTCVFTDGGKLFCWEAIQWRDHQNLPVHVKGPWEAR